MAQAIEERARFDRVRYANGWEDPELLLRGLEPRAGARVLSIAAAGDNSFTLLAAGAEVVAVDVSAAQLALVELKASAVRELPHAETLAFLGVRGETDRRLIYRRLRPDLSPAARAFWDRRPGEVAAGVAHAGKFESYFRLFRRRVLPLVHRRRRVEELLEPRDSDGRRAFYAERWDTWRWRLLFRAFFSRTLMGRLGRDPEFFRYVEGSVADRILERARYALTELPVADNPYIEYILRGRFERTLPPWLAPERYQPLRAGLGRLTLHHGPVEEAAEVHRSAGFDGFNLSDIFEYLDAATCESVYRRLAACAAPGARFAYWNLLVPRRRPESLASRVRGLEDRAAELFRRDRAFFYSRFVLEEAVG
jgi:S-adenosylmethionine-diacylglycerol 3-amino-3-carboxypropyl transferase